MVANIFPTSLKKKNFLPCDKSSTHLLINNRYRSVKRGNKNQPIIFILSSPRDIVNVPIHFLSGIFLGTSILHVTIILLYAEGYVLPTPCPQPSTVEQASLWVFQNPGATVLLSAAYSSRGSKVLIAQWWPTLCTP